MNNLPSLDQIAVKHGTDKSSLHHGYTRWYEMFFEPIRNERITLFEAGWGGYQYPDRGGEGAKTWREYFPNAIIVSIDIHPKVNIPEGIEFHQGSQDDSAFWYWLVQKYGNPDIIIDDASHVNTLSRAMFLETFFHLNPGGIYVLEDLESSWWEKPASDGVEYHGCANPRNFHAETSINLMRECINDVNERHIKGYEPYYPIESIHFFDNIVFVRKR